MTKQVRRSVPSLCAALIVVLLAARDGSSAAGGMITGTVKVTGVTSSADVVVFIQQAPGRFQPPTEPVDMDQRKKDFVPHVLPIVAGTGVRFLNSDQPAGVGIFCPRRPSRCQVLQASIRFSGLRNRRTHSAAQAF